MANKSESRNCIFRLGRMNGKWKLAEGLAEELNRRYLSALAQLNFQRERQFQVLLPHVSLENAANQASRRALEYHLHRVPRQQYSEQETLRRTLDLKNYLAELSRITSQEPMLQAHFEAFYRSIPDELYCSL